MEDGGIRFKALAVDYDGTLAEDGRVAPETLEALRRAKRSGRKLLLVTGRELEELMSVFPELDVFDVVVAENGALLYRPSPPPPTERPLASAPPPELVRTLRERGVAPLSMGRIIVATRQPHERTVMETIRDLGLELEVIFNKGAVRILPSGVDKAFGLRAALDELGIDPRQVVGVGDAENDQSLLATCGLGVAVANAVESLKEAADLVTVHRNGRGVVETIDELLEAGFENAVKAKPELVPASIRPPPSSREEASRWGH